ncbi:ribosomal L1 domain-containing protein 1-like [Tubulanus polymorphus]|uniref:ribosomal L1 domain-containing protein 1-like n=1 Tax=Tubulanus polymorphus TaxID=672921 RepID=UPI003DA31C0C
MAKGNIHVEKTAKSENGDEKRDIHIDESQLRQAVAAVCKLAQKKTKTDLLLAAGDANKILLSISFNKVYESKRSKDILIKVPLPHSLKADTTSVCLFVKDLDSTKRELDDTIDHYTELLRSKNVTDKIDIIPLKGLSTEYTEFESHRRLLSMYDLFLTDDRIVRHLNARIGKTFCPKKRFPKIVNLKAKDLKKEIDEALGSGLLTISGRGSTCMLQVAHTKHTEEQITENVLSAFKCLCEKIPGGGVNIKTLHLKTTDSTSVPVYYNAVQPTDIVLNKLKRPREEVEAEDVTTITGGKVKVYPSGRIDIIKQTKVMDKSGVEKIVTQVKPLMKPDGLALDKPRKVGGRVQKKSKKTVALTTPKTKKSIRPKKGVKKNSKLIDKKTQKKFSKKKNIIAQKRGSKKAKV